MLTSFNKIIIEVIAGIIVTVLFIVGGNLLKIMPLDVWIAMGGTFLLTAIPFLIYIRKNNSNSFIKDLGITGLWRNEQSFQKSNGVSFTDYCRKFIDEIPTGQTVRILGYDWMELFSETTVLDKHIFGENNTSRLRFEVVLLDPKSPVAIEKRAWEMNWKLNPNQYLYPEGRGGDSLQRLRSKIQSCSTVANIFAEERPQFFKLKHTPTILHFSFIMSAKKTIGVIYNPPWKGKDTLIFEAVRSPQNAKTENEKLITRHYLNDFYGFIEGYFDAIWDDQGWRTIKAVESSN